MAKSECIYVHWAWNWKTCSWTEIKTSVMQLLTLNWNSHVFMLVLLVHLRTTTPSLMEQVLRFMSCKGSSGLKAFHNDITEQAGGSGLSVAAENRRRWYITFAAASAVFNGWSRLLLYTSRPDSPPGSLFEQVREGLWPWEGPHLNEAVTQCEITLQGLCRTRSTHTEHTSRGDKDEKTQENYSAPWCYHPPAELEVRDRTILKMLGREERPFTILSAASRASVSVPIQHSA